MKKRKSNEYYVVYVKDNVPGLLSFKTKPQLQKFLNVFVKNHGSLDDGNANWIDYVFIGKKLQSELLVKI